MTASARDAFLQRVQQAVQQGNRAGAVPALPARGRVGYQGGGADLVARFAAELSAAGGQPYAVASREAAIAQVVELARSRSARKVLLGRGAFVDSLRLEDSLRAVGLEVIAADGLSPAMCRDPFFAADIGITGVDYLIAETGSVVVQARPGEPRSFSLLPPVHVAVAHRAQLVPDLFDLFDLLAKKSGGDGRPRLPSGLALITGPSKTGDIELRLVTGVHGPGEIHVIVTEQ